VIVLNVQIQAAPERLFFANANRRFGCCFGSKRGRLETLAEILLFCRKGETMTKIMYGNNLNYTQLKNYLKVLTSRGLLKRENRKYAATEKGFAFLKLFMGIHDLFRE
jgi:predicted transcriptional regulator